MRNRGPHWALFWTTFGPWHQLASPTYWYFVKLVKLKRTDEKPSLLFQAVVAHAEVICKDIRLPYVLLEEKVHAIWLKCRVENCQAINEAKTLTQRNGFLRFWPNFDISVIARVSWGLWKYCWFRRISKVSDILLHKEVSVVVYGSQTFAEENPCDPFARRKAY